MKQLKKLVCTFLALALVFTSVLSKEVKAQKPEKVKQEDRVNYLFPKGIPSSEKEMKKYLKTIKVPIRVRKVTKKGKVKLKKSSMKITVHKKLASNYKKAFKEMYKEKFPIKKNETSTYAWRMLSGSSLMSTHSFGAAIDINWLDNPTVSDFNYKPKSGPYVINSKIVNIWKRYGFSWGGSWSGEFRDLMHFEYLTSNDVK